MPTWLLLSILTLCVAKRFNVSDFGAKGDGITDNSAAFTACVNAAITSNGGTIIFPAGVFLGRLTIPAVVDRWITLELVGDSEPTAVFGTVGNAQLSNQGTIIQNNSSGVAVVSAQAGPPNHFSNIYLVVRNLQIRTSDNPSIGGIDLSAVQQCKLENVFVNTGVYDVQASRPTHGTAGVVTPGLNNGALTILRNVIVSGYAIGIVVNEHTDGDSVVVAGNVQGLRFMKANHASRFGRVGAYRNTEQITVNGSHAFSIQQVAIEKSGPGQTTPRNAWQETLYDVSDPANRGVGDITYWVVEGNVGADNANFTQLGGARIRSRVVGS